jgi:phosphopantetheine adenylyltransferase
LLRVFFVALGNSLHPVINKDIESIFIKVKRKKNFIVSILIKNNGFANIRKFVNKKESLLYLFN